MGAVAKLKGLQEGSINEGSGKNLLILHKKGFLVPETYIIEIPIFKKSAKNQGRLLEKPAYELKEIIDPQKNYAVFRSNERFHNEAFGRSILCDAIRGLNQVQHKIEKLVACAEAQMTQLRKTASAPNEDHVIIMQLPEPEFSGFVFTRNPVNGLSETILELSTTRPSSKDIQYYRLIFRNGKLLTKLDESLTCKPDLPERVVKESERIEKAFGKPVYLEWAYDSERIFWLQLNTLHSLKALNVYSNKIAKEMLPGIIKPLVWSVNTPLVSSSWKRLITELIGKNHLDLGKMTKQFYYRAYFNMGLFGDFFNLLGMPRETLEIMTLGEAHGGTRPKMTMNIKVLTYLPRIALFVLRNLAAPRNIGKFLREQKRILDSYRINISGLDEAETVKAIDEISKLNEQCSYNVIVMRLIRSFSHTMIRSALRKRGIESTIIKFDMEDLSDVDPRYSVFLLKERFLALPRELRADLEKGRVSPNSIDYTDFTKEYCRFLKRFGHLSDSTVDMSRPQWKEDPKLIIKLLADAQRPSDNTADFTPQISEALSNPMLRRLYYSFIDFEKYSLRLGFLFTYGFSLFRSYFLHIAKIFESKGYISEDSDIFYLTFDEIKRMVESKRSSPEYSNAIEKRKKEIEDCSNILLPEVIFGDISPPTLRSDSVIKRLKGLPSSQGYYTGPAKVVTTLADSDKIAEGDVLVIPYSDVSWTPLFAKAGAVISESGGLLSHCSVVARELGIPAVVAVEGATRIPNRTRIIVDGYTGEVIVIQ